MNKVLYRAILLFCCLYISIYPIVGYTKAAFDCTPYTGNGPTNSTPYTAGCQSTHPHELTSLYKTEVRTIRWPDLYTSDVTATSSGNCLLVFPNCHNTPVDVFCPNPDFINWWSGCYAV